MKKLKFSGKGELGKTKFSLLLSRVYFAGDYNIAAPRAEIRLLLQARFSDGEKNSDLGGEDGQ